VFARVRSIAGTAGMMAGCEAAEVLASCRLPCAGDPTQLLLH
jgi:hypothetical protein